MLHCGTSSRTASLDTPWLIEERICAADLGVARVDPGRIRGGRVVKLLSDYRRLRLTQDAAARAIRRSSPPARAPGASPPAADERDPHRGPGTERHRYGIGAEIGAQQPCRKRDARRSKRMTCEDRAGHARRILAPPNAFAASSTERPGRCIEKETNRDRACHRCRRAGELRVQAGVNAAPPPSAPSSAPPRRASPR
jgi:hypothetical protein